MLLLLSTQDWNQSFGYFDLRISFVVNHWSDLADFWNGCCWDRICCDATPHDLFVIQKCKIFRWLVAKWRRSKKKRSSVVFLYPFDKWYNLLNQLHFWSKIRQSHTSCYRLRYSHYCFLIDHQLLLVISSEKICPPLHGQRVESQT